MPIDTQDEIHSLIQQKATKVEKIEGCVKDEAHVLVMISERSGSIDLKVPETNFVAITFEGLYGYKAMLLCKKVLLATLPNLKVDVERQSIA